MLSMYLLSTNVLIPMAAPVPAQAATEAACLILSVDETVRNPKSEVPDAASGAAAQAAMAGGYQGLHAVQGVALCGITGVIPWSVMSAVQVVGAARAKGHPFQGDGVTV